MNEIEMGQILGRVEEGVRSLHDKLDNTILPAQVRLELRLRVVERALFVMLGSGIVVGAGLFVAREVVIGWIKQKLGITV